MKGSVAKKENVFRIDQLIIKADWKSFLLIIWKVGVQSHFKPQCLADSSIFKFWTEFLKVQVMNIVLIQVLGNYPPNHITYFWIQIFLFFFLWLSNEFYFGCFLRLTSPSARFLSSSFRFAFSSSIRASICASDSRVKGRNVGRSSSV